jgi:hypothetical protein
MTMMLCLAAPVVAKKSAVIAPSTSVVARRNAAKYMAKIASRIGLQLSVAETILWSVGPSRVHVNRHVKM